MPEFPTQAFGSSFGEAAGEADGLVPAHQCVSDDCDVSRLLRLCWGVVFGCVAGYGGGVLLFEGWRVYV